MANNMCKEVQLHQSGKIKYNDPSNQITALSYLKHQTSRYQNNKKPKYYSVSVR